jgi:hypothetical protein
MRLLLLGGVFAAAFAASVPVLAATEQPQQLAPAPASAPAPPARVGRVSLVAGKVEFRGPGDAQWSPASVNDPVANGVELRTDPKSRAEIRIGANAIDLTEGTAVTFAKLDGAATEIALAAGRIEFIVGRLAAGETIRVDLPNGSVRPVAVGRYDVAAGDAGHPAQISVFGGSAHYSGSGADIAIAAGERLSPAGAAPVVATTEPAAADEFAEWCRAHAVDDAGLAAPYFVSREMTGYAALDAAGSWRASVEYGAVWQPAALPAGWAPYRDGHWRWLKPWGWSWVDDEPWGFATSHYGRWLFDDNRWSWVPGRWSAHPVWMPAVVAFLGTQGVGLSYAGGTGPAIGWFPLSPGEIYWPGYTADIDYIRAVNAGVATDPETIRGRADGEPPAAVANAHFANREFSSVVPRTVFVAGQPAAPALVTIPGWRLRNAPAIMGSPRIGPPPPLASVRIAAAAPARGHPPAAAKAKSAAWVAAVRTAALRSRRFQEAARVRFVRLRVASSGELSRLRHSLVLRIAHADHAPPHREARKKVVRR